MNQSLFSAHCFVCILHGSVWTHAEAESSTLHRIHTSTHFNTLHTSTLTVALSCSARKCELSSLVALPQKIIKLESFQKGWQCCKNNVCLDITTSCCCSNSESVTRTGATKPNEVSKIQYVVLLVGDFIGAAIIYIMPKKWPKLNVIFGQTIPYLLSLVTDLRPESCVGENPAWESWRGSIRAKDPFSSRLDA